MAASPRKIPRKKRTRQAAKVHTSPVKQVQKQTKVKAKQQGGKKKQGDPSIGNDSTQDTKPRAVVVPWSNKLYYCYTDALLTLIEENEQYKLILGFEIEKGTSPPVTSGGRKPIDVCRSLAQKVLLVEKELIWADKTAAELGEAVKNRIYNLRQLYHKHRTSVNETGQGLLDEGWEDEIAEDTPLWNIWVKIKRTFPWYMHMHGLMKTSPVADRSAVGNSSTDIDLEVLGVGSGGKKTDDEGMGDSDVDDHGSQKWDIEDESPMKEVPCDMQASNSDNEDTNSHHGSPGLDDDRDASLPPSPVKQKPTKMASAARSTTATAGASTTSTASSRRPKGLFGELEVQFEAQRKANLEITKSNNQARVEVEKVRQLGKLKVHRMRIEAMKEEREAKMAHERELMRIRLEYQQKAALPQLQHAPASSPTAFPFGTLSSSFGSDLPFDLSMYGSDSSPRPLQFDFEVDNLG
ncbi:hypothetical protein M422DRAFT_48528 [Sphaerobolus stellatus SS14]|uniref:Uncharacterized protein n=1 Tax=Sphaerobolus stellatus (strain SS14) TaxID=990650 RepID=A0A0C9VJ76_SPHS4|nr:hypothetical protein M422DRAFT_48528 [Sphaerobolus stellatus SS14]